MEAIDRSVIPEIHAAARRLRAEYLGCLFRSLPARVAGLFAVETRRTASCG